MLLVRLLRDPAPESNVRIITHALLPSQCEVGVGC